MKNIEIKPKVVIIEDDNLSRLVLTKTVQASGLDPVAFSDGKEAIQYLAAVNVTNSIVCVVSDIMMFGSDGIDVLAFVRANKNLENLPFIFLTGVDYEVFHNLLQPYKYQAFLKKPIVPDKLINEISKYHNLQMMKAA